MKIVSRFACMVLILCAIGGCSNSPDPKKAKAQSKEEKIETALAKLSPEDRKLAEAQKLCAVSKQRLGSMDTPIKVMVQGQPVFLCCDHCEDELKKHPEETLKKANDLKAANK